MYSKNMLVFNIRTFEGKFKIMYCSRNLNFENVLTLQHELKFDMEKIIVFFLKIYIKCFDNYNHVSNVYVQHYY